MMESTRNIILVTWDFTKASENALEHAIRLSLHTGHKIRLLHVMKKGSGTVARARNEKKIKQICIEIKEKHRILADFFIVEGSLFEKIASYAENNKVSIVIMGTHGIKGFQKWFGSRAMRVIDGSRIPFIVVQDKPKNHDEITDVIYPLNVHSQEIEKISWAAFIAKYLNSKIHLVEQEKDKNKKNYQANLNLSLKKFLKNNISYTIYQADRNKDLPSSTLSLARKLDAELIVWLGNKHQKFSGFFDNEEARIIANHEKIPVMYIHPDSIISPG